MIGVQWIRQRNGKVLLSFPIGNFAYKLFWLDGTPYNLVKEITDNSAYPP